MASVTIKSTKNSRTHDVLPVGWSLCEVYEAERLDNTHWKIFQKRGPGYVIWPVEDVEEVDDLGPREQPVPVELNVIGITGSRRVSDGGLNIQQIAKQKIASTGSSTDYYVIPEWCTELRHLIQHKNMNFDVGNIFKAAYRLGEKEGIDHEYDLMKIIFFAQSELERVRREKKELQ